MGIRRKLALWICPELAPRQAEISSEMLDKIEANYTDTILLLADVYGAHRNHSRNTVSLRAAKRGGFLNELAAGANLTVKRGDSIIEWFSDNWPADLAWPRDIPRPKPSKKKEGA